MPKWNEDDKGHQVYDDGAALPQRKVIRFGGAVTRDIPSEDTTEVYVPAFASGDVCESFAGRSGDVVAEDGDYKSASVTFNPVGTPFDATTLQTALPNLFELIRGEIVLSLYPSEMVELVVESGNVNIPADPAGKTFLIKEITSPQTFYFVQFAQPTDPPGSFYHIANDTLTTLSIGNGSYAPGRPSNINHLIPPGGVARFMCTETGTYFLTSGTLPSNIYYRGSFTQNQILNIGDELDLVKTDGDLDVTDPYGIVLTPGEYEIRFCVALGGGFEGSERMIAMENYEGDPYYKSVSHNRELGSYNQVSWCGRITVPTTGTGNYNNLKFYNRGSESYSIVGEPSFVEVRKIY